MQQKVLFMLFNNQLMFLNDPNMDHRDWYDSLGGNPNNYDNVIRGFVMDGKIVYFKGFDFRYDDEVYKTAKIYSGYIRQVLNNPSLVVCCGILPGRPGEKWEPIVTLTEDELNNITQTKEVEKKPEKEFVQESIVDFKNNYNDDNFVKVACKFILFILLFTVISKVVAIGTDVMKLSSMFDFLLIVIQIVLLSVSYFMYKSKNEIAKYVSIGASVSLILAFNILDIILGVLVLLFSIDAGYFTKGIEMIKKLIKNGKGK